MDINVDQGAFQGNLGKTDEGKYLYKLDPTQFDIDKFNRDFEQYVDERKKSMQESIDKRLEELNRPPARTPVYDLSIGQISINTKDALFNTFDDLVHTKISTGTFLKENRLFYLGLTFIFVALIFFFYAFFIESTK